jgi:hypothetical protein
LAEQFLARALQESYQAHMYSSKVL